jgi:flagellar biosynthesis/type III secretory pathway protein FliH
VLAARGGACTLTLRFTPALAGTQVRTMIVPFSGANGAATVARALRGASVLDCAVPALQAHFQEGVTDAQGDNAVQAALGTAAGGLAAYPTGYQDGYQATYPAAYTAAYNQAFNAAYNAHYQGWYDTAYGQNCPTGTAAGRTDGERDGAFDGEHDGYEDGYNAAYTPAYTEGYNDGYAQGRAECLAQTVTLKDGHASLAKALGTQPRKNRSKVSAIPTEEPANTEACFVQGYNSAYNPNAYSQAYNAAVQSSPQYQAGRQAGVAQASTDAQAAGAPKGTTDGRAAAQNDGTADGAYFGYNTCYDSSYESAYTARYNSLYNTHYWRGRGVGDDDGYNAGLELGYVVGQRSCIPQARSGQGSASFVSRVDDQALSLARLSRKSFGAGRSWLRIGRDGMRLDQFVQRPMRRGMEVGATHRDLRSRARSAARTLTNPGSLRLLLNQAASAQGKAVSQ